jgi:hypothetical protein
VKVNQIAATEFWHIDRETVLLNIRVTYKREQVYPDWQHSFQQGLIHFNYCENRVELFYRIEESAIDFHHPSPY